MIDIISSSAMRLVFSHGHVDCAAFLRRFALQVVIGTKVGRTKHMRIMPGGALETEQSLSGPSSVFVGKKLDEHRGSFLLEYPMDKGHVVDGGWDAMESLWEVRKDGTHLFELLLLKSTFLRH